MSKKALLCFNPKLKDANTFFDVGIPGLETQIIFRDKFIGLEKNINFIKKQSFKKFYLKLE